MLTGGMLLLAKVGSSGSPIVYIMLPGLLTAAGIAMSIVPSTIAATQGAKEGQAGLASGLVNTSRQIGGGLGLAILVTLATSRSSHLIGDGHGVRAVADRRLPARLPDRRRPRRRGGDRDVHGAAQARRRDAALGARAWRSRSSWSSPASSRSTPRSRARTARRSAPTPPAAPTASSPSRRCTRRSCRGKARPPPRASWNPATSSRPTSTTSTIPRWSARAGR